MSSSLREILFWSSANSCTIAQVLIVRSELGERRLPEPHADVPLSRDGVELFWAILPAVALGVLFLFTWRAIEQRTTAERLPAAATMEAAR
jgi:hypothetical protein